MLFVCFNFTPPNFAEEQEQRLAAFREQLETAIGVPVEQEDRVWFMIRRPAEDTFETAKTFLERSGSVNDGNGRTKALQQTAGAISLFQVRNFASPRLSWSFAGLANASG